MCARNRKNAAWSAATTASSQQGCLNLTSNIGILHNSQYVLVEVVVSLTEPAWVPPTLANLPSLLSAISSLFILREQPCCLRNIQWLTLAHISVLDSIIWLNYPQADLFTTTAKALGVKRSTFVNFLAYVGAISRHLFWHLQLFRVSQLMWQPQNRKLIFPWYFYIRHAQFTFC
jgi:hypothetical protein